MKSFIKCRWVVVFSLIATLQPYSLAQQQASGAKALFYDPESGTVLKTQDRKKNPQNGIIKVKQVPSSRAKYTGIHYWIELDGVGQVTADHTFHTGDRIAIHIRSNVDGYMSLWSINPAGAGTRLFPSTGQAAQANFIKADDEYITPGKIRFTLPVEDERLLIFFSRTQADLPEYSNSSDASNVLAKTRDAAGSKALLFETENKNPTEVGNYVVNKNGGAVVREIRLKHR
jgi:hypothetical protein